MSNPRDGQISFSWARPGAEDDTPRTLIGRLRRSVRDVSWFDVAAALGITAVFDLVVGLLISGYYGSKCRDVCTLHQQAHEDRMLLILVPLLLGLPPLLVALLARRLRVAVGAVQAAVCAAFMIHAALDLRTVESHINGTAKCWTALYSDKDCPWGPV
ncbi:MAG TPA: hypothetical protein VFU36_13835 [Jatrophihabitans sp.]|nr:hypothetical protein [Jatrophihabitans sp.]